MSRRIAISAVLGIAVGTVLSIWRGFPWYLATVSAVAAGALVYTVFRTGDNLRRLRS